MWKMKTFVLGVRRMADRCPTDVYYEFHGMEQRNYNPIEIARQYAPKFDKPVVDMVEVVRCNDCRYYMPKTHGCTMGSLMCPDESDYCSRGVRK